MTVSAAPGTGWASLAEVDPELWAAMVGERERQRWKIELIASENYASAAVMEAQGSWLTNKYAEGLPGKRYYGGCEFVDVVERLAIERALALFPGAEHVNVQPHSGAQANMAAYFCVLEPGDRILGMNLAHGGHLTHGSHGQLLRQAATRSTPTACARTTQRIDYDALERQAREVRPKLIVAGASAYPRIIDFERMGAIARAVDALLMVDMAHIAGLVAAGLHPSPFPHADLVTTTTHKTLRGPRGGLVFCREPTGQGIDKAVFPGIQGGPLMHVIAAKAVALKLAAAEEFRDDQRRTVENAAVLAETLMRHGAQVVSGGTDNHLMLVDVTPLGVTGKEAEALLDERRHHRQQERHPVRPAAAEHGVRHPAWVRRRPPRAASAPTRCARSAAHRARPDASRRRRRLAARGRRGARHLRPLPGAGPAQRVSIRVREPRPEPAGPHRCGARRGGRLSFVLTPLAIRCAHRVGAIDQPDDGAPRPPPAHPARRRHGRRGRPSWASAHAWWSWLQPGPAAGRRITAGNIDRTGAAGALRRRGRGRRLRLHRRPLAAPGALAVAGAVRAGGHRHRRRRAHRHHRQPASASSAEPFARRRSCAASPTSARSRSRRCGSWA